MAMPNPVEGIPPSRSQLKDDANSLNGVIRAAVAANLQIDSDMKPEVSDLIRNAVDGLLEAAQLLAKRLSHALDLEEEGQ